jgi:hypothetical protein
VSGSEAYLPSAFASRMLVLNCLMSDHASNELVCFTLRASSFGLSPDTGARCRD